jgi:hypothetical protein
MSNKKFGCVPLLGTLIVLLVGGGYLFNRFLLGKELTPLEGAKLIPQETIMTSYITTETQDWSQLEQVGIPQEILQAGIDNLEKDLTNNSTINYEQDIQPWLGGAMVAVLPETAVNNNSDNVLFILGIKNKLKARDFVKKLEKEGQQTSKETEYKGIKITEFIQPDQETMYSAVVSNKLLLAANRQPLEKAIDTYKGEPSLLEKPEAKQALSKPSKLKNSLVQIYITNYSQLAKSLSKGQAIPPVAITQIQQVNSVALAISPEPKGLHLQAIAELNESANQTNLPLAKGKILSQFPGDTVALISGQGINQIWSTSVTELEKDQQFNNYLQMMRTSLQQYLNLNLDQDIFGWMDGEFVFAAIENQQNIIPELGIGLGGAIMLETTNPDAAKTTLSKLENIFSFSLSPSQKNVNGTNITEWREPESNFAFSYGWVNDNSLLFTIGDSVFESMSNSKNNSLVNSDKFKNITKELPSDNFGYFYLDFEPIIAIVNNLPSQEKQNLTPEAIALINSIQGLGAASTLNKSTSQVDLLVKFK